MDKARNCAARAFPYMNPISRPTSQPQTGPLPSFPTRKGPLPSPSQMCSKNTEATTTPPNPHPLLRNPLHVRSPSLASWPCPEGMEDQLAAFKALAAAFALSRWLTPPPPGPQVWLRRPQTGHWQCSPVTTNMCQISCENNVSLSFGVEQGCSAHIAETHSSSLSAKPFKRAYSWSILQVGELLCLQALGGGRISCNL